jgi:hypothetical protein
LLKKQSKSTIKANWILLNCFIILTFGIKPPKVRATAFAQVDPRDIAFFQVSNFMPPAIILLWTITIAQTTETDAIRLLHCMVLAKQTKNSLQKAKQSGGKAAKDRNCCRTYINCEIHIHQLKLAIICV